MKTGYLVCALLAFFAANALGGSMNEFETCRCQNGLASKGDKKDEVLQECGKPVSQRFTNNRDCSEIWVYNFGRYEFMQGICFDRSGQVKKVISLGYGH